MRKIHAHKSGRLLFELSIKIGQVKEYPVSWRFQKGGIICRREVKSFCKGLIHITDCAIMQLISVVINKFWGMHMLHTFN